MYIFVLRNTMMKFRKLLLILSLIIGNSLLSQYKPIDTTDYLKRKEFLEELKKKNENLIQIYKTQYSGKTKSEVEDYYKAYYNGFEQNIKNKKYTFHKGFNDKLNQIVAKIQANNPNVPKNLYILVAKDNTPNAYCLADGIFIINMGLFSWLQNEDQIASVLSHEIAHYMLQHSIKSLVKTIEQDKENLSKAKNNTGYEKSQATFNLIKNRTYNLQEKNRKQEIQADSLGFIIFKNTDYEKGEFYHALKRLQQYNSTHPKSLKLETYRKLYSLPKQPFKESWLKQENFKIYNYDLYKSNFNKDSLASHPDIQQRLIALKKSFPQLKSLKKPIKINNETKKLKYIAQMEVLPNLYYSENYGAGVYVAMQLLQDRKEEIYNRKWLGKFFSKIYEGRKNYQLNRYLDRIESEEQNKSYQQFLNFLWNLNLTEIKHIAEHYQ